MPRYRVRPTCELAHNGATLREGAIVELPRPIAEDGAVSHLIDEVDGAGNPVTPPPADDLERFRAHERVSILRDRLTAAEVVVAELKARLEDEDRRLREAVLAVAVAKEKKPDTPPAAGKGDRSICTD